MVNCKVPKNREWNHHAHADAACEVSTRERSWPKWSTIQREQDCHERKALAREDDDRT